MCVLSSVWCSSVYALQLLLEPGLRFLESQLKPLEHAAHVAYDNGRYLESISLLKQALALDPKNPWLLTDMGSAQNEASNFTGAGELYRCSLNS